MEFDKIFPAQLFCLLVYFNFLWVPFNSKHVNFVTENDDDDANFNQLPAGFG